MTSRTLITSLVGLSLLAACGDGTPFQDSGVAGIGTASFGNDTYTVVQGDAEIDLAIAESVLANGQRIWLGTSDRAVAFEDTNMLAIGGVAQTGTPFAGLTGVGAATPDGNATYTGRYGVISGDDSYDTGDLTLSYNFANATLTNIGGTFGVDATVNPNGIAGTVDFAGQTGTLAGIFYGTDGLAGAFAGEQIGGVISGTAN